MEALYTVSRPVTLTTAQAVSLAVSRADVVNEGGGYLDPSFNRYADPDANRYTQPG
jgi:hypothetical protein